jgi:hypothetical protein
MGSPPTDFMQDHFIWAGVGQGSTITKDAYTKADYGNVGVGGGRCKYYFGKNPSPLVQSGTSKECPSYLNGQNNPAFTGKMKKVTGTAGCAYDDGTIAQPGECGEYDGDTLYRCVSKGLETAPGSGYGGTLTDYAPAPGGTPYNAWFATSGNPPTGGGYGGCDGSGCCTDTDPPPCPVNGMGVSGRGPNDKPLCSWDAYGGGFPIDGDESRVVHLTGNCPDSSGGPTPYGYVGGDCGSSQQIAPTHYRVAPPSLADPHGGVDHGLFPGGEWSACSTIVDQATGDYPASQTWLAGTGTGIWNDGFGADYPWQMAAERSSGVMGCGSTAAAKADVPCPEGYVCSINPASNSATILPCPAHKTCPAGTWDSVTFQGGVMCPQGWVCSDEGGTVNMTKCPADHLCAGDTWALQKCPAGQSSLEGWGSCRDNCEPGHYWVDAQDANLRGCMQVCSPGFTLNPVDPTTGVGTWDNSFVPGVEATAEFIHNNCSHCPATKCCPSDGSDPFDLPTCPDAILPSGQKWPQIYDCATNKCVKSLFGDL